MSYFTFQEKAINDLVEVFIKLWKQENRKLPIVLKSPTGSGKTFMATSFINNLNNLPNWNKDKAFIWITFSDDLAMQSKNKFNQYYRNNLTNKLITVNEIDKGKLYKDDVLFINWQKLVSSAAENRVLRRPELEYDQKEIGYYFEDFIDNTHVDNREIILLIDESHKNASTVLSQDIINYINPKIILHITATPNESIELESRRLNSFIEVERKDVVGEGLIKEKIVVQTDEDLIKFKDRDLNEALLDLAIEKRIDLKNQYEKLGKKINPLILIQLPNDDNKLIEIGEKTKEIIVLNYLYKKGITEEKIALWFDGKQKNMEFISDNENEIKFMLFKQAAGTGWDCPRAHILVMFREITSNTFYQQTVGRILRMSEPNKKKDYKDNPDLRTGFLYTNYNRNEISIPDQSYNNLPNFYISNRIKSYTNIEIESAYISRVDYGDLSDSAKFQESFIKTMDSYFGIKDDDLFGKSSSKLEEKGLDLNSYITNKIVVNAKYEDYDMLSYEFHEKGEDFDFEMSSNDVEKTFDYYCYKILKEQTDVGSKISNISRSWSPLKSAIRVWMKKNITVNKDINYRIFIKDINKNEASVLRPAISKSIKDYKPILEQILTQKRIESNKDNIPIFKIQDQYYYNENYEEENTKMCVLDKFYVKKDDYRGKQNEINFMKYIDNKSGQIEWWFKNGDHGKEFYAIKYFNTSQKRDALFYPDWIIKFNDGRIGIFDTKSGITAENTEGRAEELANKLIELGDLYIGGITIYENGIWYYNDSKKYEYIRGSLNSDWKQFESLFL